MLERMAAFIIGEGNWLPMAMGAGLAAAAALVLYRHRRAGLTGRRIILAAMNLFTGVMLAIMGFGHLLAVTTKLVMGTLDGSPFFFYAIGLAITAPSWLIIRHTRAILADEGETARQTVRLNAWMAVTLGVLGLVNLPLALPALCNIGYSLHRRRWVGWTIVGVAVVAGVGLFIGGLVFMASGQTFEEFSRLR